MYSKHNKTLSLLLTAIRLLFVFPISASAHRLKMQTDSASVTVYATSPYGLTVMTRFSAVAPAALSKVLKACCRSPTTYLSKI